jgi:hypothetical protein
VLLIEVLSPGTWREAFGVKLERQLRCPGLLRALTLAGAARARLWRPDVDGGAEPVEFFGLDVVIPLPAPSLELSMAELYRDVDFVAAEAS